jgi:hypothetical protein
MLQMINSQTTDQVALPKGRFVLGVSIFGLAFCVPLLIPAIVASSLPSSWKATLSGALALGIPEVLMVLAAAVLGKSGFNYLKKRTFRLIKRYALPKSVSRTRYQIGLMLFILTLITGWLGPSFCLFMPCLEKTQLLVSALGDIIFLISLFVLGGDFWDKLKSLFIYEVKAQLPGSRQK